MLNTLNKKKLDELLQHVHKNISTKKETDKLITHAYNFAIEAHKNDKRASGEPYISHPFEAAIIMASEIPLDAVSVAATLLHDVVEDTKFTIKDIKAEFGDEVAEIVNGATKIEGMFENYAMKQVESYKKMLLSMTSDIRVMLIKFADRLHNLRTLEFLSNEKQLRMAQETLEIYAPLAHRFGLSNVKIELEDLSFKYLDRKTYDELAKTLKEKKREREKFIRKFLEPIKQRLIQEKFKFEVSGRAKHLYSIYKKLKTRKKTLDEIYDLFAVRIIVDTDNKNDCFSVYGICSEIYLPVPERFKDYISLPKQNGYQSIHTTLVSKEGKMVEVQIRTREMHEVAEKGIAAHWKYKENHSLKDRNLENWMKSIRETIEQTPKEEETSQSLMESFRLNLYQDEIYCFTPKGELKILPAGATALDFAFEIHTEIGSKCIGAKVNGKIVNLDTPLKSGDQIEIITSKNQRPKRDWEKFLITHKAKADIRKFFNAEKRLLIKTGKEIWEKKTKKHKIHINEDDLLKLIHKLKFKDLGQFYSDISQDETKLDELIEILTDKNKLQIIDQKPEDETAEVIKTSGEFQKFIKEARANIDGISIGNGKAGEDLKGIQYDFAKCCNPIPGDDVIGFITFNKGIRIHRKSCKNIVNLFLHEPNRIVQINWNETGSDEFTGGVRIIGEDRPGILNDITNIISKNFKTINIKSVDIKTKSSMFEGTLILSIQNLKQLNLIIEKINQQEGVFSATRYEV
jgi:GTP diphosphokinase / guanosine-3',5'-bis(diphosphate) 3'-diphosphatase